MTTNVEFVEIVRTVSVVARRHDLTVPAFRSPPRTPDATRSIRRTNHGVVVAVRITNRLRPEVERDVIAGVVAANEAVDEDSFYAECWEALR